MPGVPATVEKLSEVKLPVIEIVSKSIIVSSYSVIERARSGRTRGDP